MLSELFGGWSEQILLGQKRSCPASGPGSAAGHESHPALLGSHGGAAAGFSLLMTLDYVLVHDMSAASASFQLFLPSGGSQEMVGGGEGREEDKSFVELRKVFGKTVSGKKSEFLV